jgi:hypothetical protein
LNFCSAKARQRYAQFRGKLTRQCFNFHHDSGENRAGRPGLD